MKMALDSIPYSDSEWRNMVTLFLRGESGLDSITGTYRVCEVKYNPQYGEEIDRMVWEGDIYEL
jgi:hypothetical protein